MLRVLNLLMIILILITAAPVSALAVTILDADISDSLHTRISDHDPNRIRIANSYIAAAIGPRNGRIAIEKDEKQGEIFIRINDHDPDKDKAFTLFLTDAQGRDYNLLIKPANIPGQSIMIISSHTHQPAERGKRPVGASPREARIKKLIRGMAVGHVPHRCTSQATDVKVLLWRDTDYRMKQNMQCGDFSVERYLLTNNGKTEIRLVEQELYESGVAAVAIKKFHLNGVGAISLTPGQSTTVILVREMQ